MKLLGTLGFTISIKGPALFRSVSQPFLDRKAIALGLRNLLALFVEKHFIDEAFGFPAAQRLGDLARLDAAVGQVLAIHFIIDVQRYPARSEEHTSELQSLMRISYAVFCLKKKKNTHTTDPR